MNKEEIMNINSVESKEELKEIEKAECVKNVFCDVDGVTPTMYYYTVLFKDNTKHKIGLFHGGEDNKKVK